MLRPAASVCERMTPCRVMRSLLAAVVLGVALARPALAESDEVALEYKVKAGYLFNFAKFVEWPADAFAGAADPFVIGVAGSEVFARALETVLAGRKVNDRPFVVRRLGGPVELDGCHVLFVGGEERDAARQLVESVRKRAILTVGECGRFGELGGMIGFRLADGNVKLDANPAAAATAGLRISSKLLAASRIVKTDAKP